MIARMRFLGVVLICAVAQTNGGAAGEGLSPGDRDAIRAVIESQIAAFRRDVRDLNTNKYRFRSHEHF